MRIGAFEESELHTIARKAVAVWIDPKPYQLTYIDEADLQSEVYAALRDAVLEQERRSTVQEPHPKTVKCLDCGGVVVWGQPCPFCGLGRDA